MNIQFISHGAQIVIAVGYKEHIKFKVSGQKQPLLDVFYYDLWWFEPSKTIPPREFKLQNAKFHSFLKDQQMT
jgi:hypothetical protein